MTPDRPTPPPERSAAATLITNGSADSAYAASPHVLSSYAALEVMSRGGNAIDGAIAANAVQGVVAPDTCGIGGDLFALIHRPGESAPTVLNASGRAGQGVSAARVREEHGALPYRHPWTITVPGCVAGWHELSERHGNLPLATSLGPAIELATNGFPVSAELARSLERLAPMIMSQASAAPLYPGEAAPAPGATIARPGLARTLRAVAESGPEAFYSGSVAAAIVDATSDGLTLEDLANPAPEWVNPLGIDLFGLTAWTVPPNTQGYLTLAAAWIFEQLAPPKDPRDPAYVHAAIEAYSAMAWERDDLVSDPDTAPMADERLLDPERLRSRLNTIAMDRAGTWPQPAPAPGGTAYLCVRDASGIGVSLIQSNFAGIGTGVSAGDTGVFLHNRGAGFNVIEGHPNELRPGRRPLHTLSPTLWTAGTELRLLLGTRGGQYQPQLLLQTALGLLHADVPRAEVQTLPRWQLDGWERDGEPQVKVEERTPEATVNGLAARGHSITRVPDWNEGWGPVSYIGVADDDVYAAVDPRVSTSAALRR